MAPEKEYKPKERSIHLFCQLQLMRDVTLILILRYNDNPEIIELQKGTWLTLIDDRQMFCATSEGCGSGPAVRIDPTKGIDIPIQHLGRILVIPACCIELHPNVL